MLKTTPLACAVLCALSIAAEAGPRPRAGLHPQCNITMPCEMPYASSPQGLKRIRGKYIARQIGIGGPRASARRDSSRGDALLAAPTASIGALTAGVVAPLAAKVAEIEADCGSKLISGIRHRFVAGTRRLSLHAAGKAVDLTGNPGCIYAHLAGWPGGYSTDYPRMRHVHLSYDADGGREMGLRFVHGRKRYGHRRHHHRRYVGAR